MAEAPYATQRWKRLRRTKLQQQPLCEQCERDGRLKPATVVDHIIPVRLGGDPFPPLDRLASLCASCHGAKTARGAEAGAVRTTKPRRGCDAEGRPLDHNHPWAKEKSLRADGLDTAARHDLSISFGFGVGDG